MRNSPINIHTNNSTEAHILHLPLTQEDVCRAQDYCADQVQAEVRYQHYHADGVYLRVMIIDAGTFVVGKAHRTRHIAQVLKGSCSVTSDDGSVMNLIAPSIFVVEPGRKKMILAHEELWFSNIHPSDTDDLDLIEAKVIVPEEEYRASLLSLQSRLEVLEDLTKEK
jgi:hypothetical protein